MEQEILLSRADLAAVAGIPDDALAFWIRNGLLKSETTEARKHHRFSLHQAKIAAILKQSRLQGMNVGAMRDLVAGLHEATDAFAEFKNLPQPANAIADKQDKHPNWNAAPAWLGHNLEYGEGVFMAYRNDSGRLLLSPNLGEDALPAASIVAFDLARTLGGIVIEGGVERAIGRAKK